MFGPFMYIVHPLNIKGHVFSIEISEMLQTLPKAETPQQTNYISRAKFNTCVPKMWRVMHKSSMLTIKTYLNRYPIKKSHKQSYVTIISSSAGITTVDNILYVPVVIPSLIVYRFAYQN